MMTPQTPTTEALREAEADLSALRTRTRELETRISWLEGTAMPHARRQENANGFQKGWHAALNRAGEHAESIDALRALVPEPAVNPDESLPLCAADAELARLRAQGTWQPIATAPKDGSRVMIWHDDYVSLAFWGTNMKAWLVTNVGPVEATHWQPLPAPPDTEGA